MQALRQNDREKRQKEPTRKRAATREDDRQPNPNLERGTAKLWPLFLPPWERPFFLARHDR